MSTRWTQTSSGVHARAAGPGRGASLAAAVGTLGVATLALVIGAAALMPAPASLGDGGVAAQASPTAPVTARGDATPPPTATMATGTAAPVGTDAPVASLVPSSPGPTPRASAVPAATPAASREPGQAAPVLARVTTDAPVVEAGREVGRVTVQAVRNVRAPSATVAPGKRLMVAVVDLSASSRLTYDELHWRLEDAQGGRWEPVPGAVTDALGAGILAPSTTRIGEVGFLVPKGVTVRSVILTDGAGTDLVVFDRSRPSL